MMQGKEDSSVHIVMLYVYQREQGEIKGKISCCIIKCLMFVMSIYFLSHFPFRNLSIYPCNTFIYHIS